MKGKISQDDVVAAPACDVWGIYRGFEVAHFVNQHLSHVIGTVDFIEGDGQAGSVVRLTFPPGTELQETLGIGYMIEKFRIMDDEKRIKEVEQVEGGYLALGCTSLVMRLEIIDKPPQSTIVRSTIEYEMDEKLAQNVSLISLKALEIIAQTVEKHLVATKTTS